VCGRLRWLSADPRGATPSPGTRSYEESAQTPPPTSSLVGAELNARDRQALREARTEAVIVLAIDVALLGGLAALDKAKDWDIIDLPWWAWLLLASPALLLMVMMLAAPLAELSPGRVRNASVALLGLLVAADAVAVGVLLDALAGATPGA
jgi:hypothetical protein